jgi:uncharacterized protein YciI
VTTQMPTGGVPPIRREILVDASQDTAFEAFTARIGRWWPLADLSVYGAGSTVEFADGEIVERSAGGDTAIWGSVTMWNPPAALSFTWHPGRGPDGASHVLVTFAEFGAALTLVRLEHSGWEIFDEPGAARAEYNQGWPRVLDCYRDHVVITPGTGQATAEPAAETWVALLHRPGPSAPADGTIFDDPRFAWHVEFLGRMREAGYLVAAGPLPDEPGAGMTVLRLPGAGQAEKATKLAAEADQSVAAGLLAVTVRPWQVLLHA